MQLPIITLKPGKERSLRNFHPWVFSGAIARMDNGIEDGSLVDVISSDKEFLGRGLYNNGSISVRIITFSQTNIDEGFWTEKFKKAIQVREHLGLFNNPKTNVFRLIHGEGDGLPGLIVDFYNGSAVLQSHNLGIHLQKKAITAGLLETLGKKVSCVYDKSSETMPAIPGLVVNDQALYGTPQETEIVENGNKFLINFETGQKTGFFIDQRDNRALLAGFSKGKDVLNTFCYSGGFSIYALNAGAKTVTSLDSSKKAMELADKNVALNGFEKNHTSVTDDAFDFLKKNHESFDTIVLDPPAFAKHLKAVPNAAKGYQRLNAMGISKIRKNGILFTFSCSQVIDKSLFRKIIFAAAAQTGRNVRILYQLGQPGDHPISIYHPEGEYLKGLVLHVE